MPGYTLGTLFDALTNTPIDHLLSDVWVQWGVTLVLAGCVIYTLWCVHAIVFGILRNVLFIVLLGGIIAFIGTIVWRPHILWGKDVSATIALWQEFIMSSIMSSPYTSTAKQHFQTAMQNLTKRVSGAPK